MSGGGHQALELGLRCDCVGASELFQIHVQIGFERSTHGSNGNGSGLGQDKIPPRHGAPMTYVETEDHEQGHGYLVGQEECWSIGIFHEGWHALTGPGSTERGEAS